ncbi:MAG: hypothetical protein JNJ85_00880 [Candidatus Kapabacteria bacterium]|nr:hypothetical protein [Candidatus Kapabacteria bacterium]
MNKVIIIISLIIFTFSTANAIGIRGEYIMKGTAYNAKMKPLRNVVIVIEAKDKVIVVHTTKTGAYWVKVPFETLCWSGTMPDNLRGKFLPLEFLVMWNDKTIKISNQAKMFFPQDTIIKNIPTKITLGYDKNGNQLDVIQNLVFK